MASVETNHKQYSMNQEIDLQLLAQLTNKYDRNSFHVGRENEERRQTQHQREESETKNDSSEDHPWQHESGLSLYAIVKKIMVEKKLLSGSSDIYLTGDRKVLTLDTPTRKKIEHTKPIIAITAITQRTTKTQIGSIQ